MEAATPPRVREREERDEVEGCRGKYRPPVVTSYFSIRESGGALQWKANRDAAARNRDRAGRLVNHPV